MEDNGRRTGGSFAIHRVWVSQGHTDPCTHAQDKQT